MRKLFAILLFIPAVAESHAFTTNWQCTLNGKPTPLCDQPNTPTLMLRQWDISNGNCHDERPAASGQVVCRDGGKVVWEAVLSGGKLNGLERETRSDGAYHRSWVQGVQQGIARDFDKSGKLKQEEAYSKGVKTGPTKTFHPNGKLERAWDMKGSVEYLADGKLRNLQCAKPVVSPEMTRLCGYDGKPSTVRLHDSAGKVIETITYLDGSTAKSIAKGEGKAAVTYENKGGISTRTEKYPSGKLKSVATAKGTQVLSEKTYFKSGRLEAERRWDGERLAQETLYFENGQVALEKKRRGGASSKLVDARTFYDDGGKELVGSYVEEQGRWEGKRSREWNGSFAYDTLWFSMVPEGKMQRYYENGKPMAFETYVKGKLDGPATYFYEEGGKMTEATWKDGKRARAVTYEKDGSVKSDEDFYEDGSRKKVKGKKKTQKAH